MTTMREFSRRLSHFKRLAAGGRRVEVMDRQGRCFVFEAKKPVSILGAGKHLAKGRPLSADPIPPEEWKGLM